MQKQGKWENRLHMKADYWLRPFAETICQVYEYPIFLFKTSNQHAFDSQK